MKLNEVKELAQKLEELIKKELPNRVFKRVLNELNNINPDPAFASKLSNKISRVLNEAYELKNQKKAAEVKTQEAVWEKINLWPATLSAVFALLILFAAGTIWLKQPVFNPVKQSLLKSERLEKTENSEIKVFDLEDITPVAEEGEPGNLQEVQSEQSGENTTAPEPVLLQKKQAGKTNTPAAGTNKGLEMMAPTPPSEPENKENDAGLFYAGDEGIKCSPVFEPSYEEIMQKSREEKRITLKIVLFDSENIKQAKTDFLEKISSYNFKNIKTAENDPVVIVEMDKEGVEFLIESCDVKIVELLK